MIISNAFNLYTDGACDPNPGLGGYGFVIERNEGERTEFSSKAYDGTTNNKMELMAVIDGLRRIHERHGPSAVNVYSDSKYVVAGITQWIHGWKKNCWITSKRKPVLNANLWQALDDMRASHKLVRFEWVKGHAGHPQNERADQLACSARLRVQEHTDTIDAQACERAE